MLFTPLVPNRMNKVYTYGLNHLSVNLNDPVNSVEIAAGAF